MALLELLNLPARLHKVSLLIFRFFLKIIDVAKLVHCQDVVVRWSHVILQVNAIFEIVGEVSLGLELVNPVEPVVAPALSHLELALVHPEDHLGGTQVIN